MDDFWLTADQFGRLDPHLPTDTRGKARVDDRRVISGIVHVLKSGGRWVDAPALYGPRKTLYNRFVRWADKGIWQNLFHALASAGGPPAQVLTGGHVADCTAVDTLLGAVPKTGILHGDKGYDSNAVRAKIESKGAAPSTPWRRPV